LIKNKAAEKTKADAIWKQKQKAIQYEIKVRKDKAKKIKAQIKKQQERSYVDKFFTNSKDAGTFGGSCVCPSGATYQVGTKNNDCKQMMCDGGKPGPCNKTAGIWSHKKVVCNSESAETKQDIAGKSKELEAIKKQLEEKNKQLESVKKNVQSKIESKTELNKESVTKLEAKYKKMNDEAKAKLKNAFEKTLANHEAEQKKLSGEYATAIANQKKVESTNKKSNAKLSLEKQVLEMKKQISEAIKNNDIAKIKKYQKKVSDVDGKIAEIQEKNKKKGSLLQQKLAELKKLQGGGKSERILQDNINLDEEVKIVKLVNPIANTPGVEKAEKERLQSLAKSLFKIENDSLWQTEQAQAQRNRYRQRLADKLDGNYKKDVYIKNIKIEKT